MIKIFHSIYSDFCLLDDETCDCDDKYIKIKAILKYFRTKNIDYQIFSYRRIAYELKKEIIKTEIKIDLIITIGKGGQVKTLN